MKISLLNPASNEWTRILSSSPHDFYHLPSYAELSGRLDKGDPHAIFVEDDGDQALLLPIIKRPLADSSELWDAISPYGYPGPIVRASSEDFATQALNEASAWLRNAGCVSLFVRLHPLLGPAPEPANALRVQHGETVHIDLRKSTEEHWKETMSGHRNEINRAIKAGHRAYFDERFEHIERFVAIYQATMSRVSASASYFFDLAYVNGMRKALGDRLKLAVIEIGGAIAGAGLFVETGSIVQYHLSGTDEAFMRERPTKLMLHFVRSWAKERGARWLHLGGGVGGIEDSLFKFKAGFSKERTPFYTLRITTDPDRYRALSKAKHPELDPSELGGFFPLYRRPA
jgi:hypothetical protein